MCSYTGLTGRRGKCLLDSAHRVRLRWRRWIKPDDLRYVDLATIPDEMREEQSREQAEAPTMTGASVHMSLTSFAHKSQLSPVAIPPTVSKTLAGALLQLWGACPKGGQEM